MSDADFDSAAEFNSVQTQQMLADIASTMRTANQHQEVVAKQLAAINGRLETLEEPVNVKVQIGDAIALGCWLSIGAAIAGFVIFFALGALGVLGILPFFFR